MAEFDVIVVGVGSMGSAVCYQLAKRGVRVLGLEQFDIPHGLGSAHGFSRMIRLAYYESPHYVALLRRGLDLWYQLEADSGEKLLYRTGGLYMGPMESELLAGSLRAAREHGVEHELLEHDDCARRFEQFHLPDNFVGFYETDVGFLLPERVIAAHAIQALHRGAQLRGREPVVDWHADGTGVEVSTNQAKYTADRLVFCSGAWSAKLIKQLAPSLTVTRQVQGWVWPRRPELFQLGKFPCWAIDFNEPQFSRGLFYGFPMMNDNPGLKVAQHWPMKATDPDNVVRDPLPGDLDTFMPVLQRVLPSAIPETSAVLALRTCLYTNSPDSHFIIDRHPDPRYRDRVIIACGFSGHGFKFASVIGEALADLAMHGKTDLPIDFLSMGRVISKQ